MKLRCLRSLIIISLMAVSSALTTLRNEDVKWILSNPNGSIRIPAEVPGGVYGSLMDAGILNDGDFYYRFNDLLYRSIGYENWTYSSRFQIPARMLNVTRIIIEFEGLDTVSTVALDGFEIGKTDNMFVHYSFDIGQFLETNNSFHNLSIQFESPVEWAKNSFQHQLQDYEVPPRCVDPAFRGECHANHIRKMQASFGWDWGPAFPNMGIWRPWKIIAWSTQKIDNLIFWATPQQQTGMQNLSLGWTVYIKVYFDAAELNQNIFGNLRVKLGDKLCIDQNVSATASQFSYIYSDNFSVPAGTVESWWPNGYGEQPLYNLSAHWTSFLANEINEKTVRVGFRTVELDQSFIDDNKPEMGRHFRMKVNNVTLFMKGSNWIPAHVLPERVNPDYVKQLLQDAAKTHQNSLRVWGGGIYETDSFYETADELGILIWQDFMFACSMYPSSEDFLRSVTKEVETQVKRLQFHPSIALWAGNNENEAALRGNWYGTSSNFSLYQRDYVKLYVDTVRAATLPLDPIRPFVISSPSNGIESEEEGFVARNPYNNLYGDVHYYNYDKDGWKWDIYPQTRFASEYGYQSWPSYRTLKEVTTENDRRMNSQMMGHRQHHPFGNIQLLMQISNHFRTEDCFNYDLRSFKIYLYLIQIHQAVAVKTETEFYRRGKNRVDADGSGYTSGALYWQLNDIWQGASWSSIEFGGRWKMLHYFASGFFSPVLLSPFLQDKEVKVQIVNDLLHDIENVTLTVRIRSFLQLGPLSVTKKNIGRVEAGGSEIIASYHLQNDLHFDDTCFTLMFEPSHICFITFSLTSSLESAEAYLFLEDPKYFTLKPAYIQITNVTESKLNNFFDIILQTGNPALFVWLETDIKGVFSDNGFLMFETMKTLTFEAREDTASEELMKSIEITTLADTYNTDQDELQSSDSASNYEKQIYKILKL